MIRKNDIIEGIIIKDGFTISSGDIAIRSNTSIITPGSGTMSIDFKIDEITTLYQVADVETKVQVNDFVKISSKNTMDERYIEVHKDGINLGGIGSGFVYAGPGGELTTSLNGGTISVISVGATGATGPGGTINQNEIAFGTGTGITSSVYFKLDKDTLTLSLGTNTCVSDSSIINGQENSSTSSNSSIISGLFNNIYNSAYSSIVGGHNNLHNSAYSLVSGYRNELISGNNLSILGGQYNFIGTSSNSAILSGSFNEISNSPGSIVLGGCGNTSVYTGVTNGNQILGGKMNLIGGGSFYGDIPYNGNFSNKITNSESTIVLGASNNLANLATNSTILGGGGNIINQDISSSILGGGGNSILLFSINSTILGGLSNQLNNYSQFSTILGGTGHQMNTGKQSVIAGGQENNIINSEKSTILGGQNNNIIDSLYSSIIGGLSLTLNNEDKVVYVPTLKIDSVTDSGTSSVKLLTYGTTKNVEYINLYTEVTYSGMTSLISSNGLVPGTLYKITDRGDRGLFFRALTNNTLDKRGTRLMLCPTNYLPGIYSGVYNKGVWYPGMTASANQLAIWGGQVWKNNAGVSGTASSILALDSNWTLVDKTTFSNGEYEQKQFSIMYDFDNDWIENQWDGYGNEVGKDYTFMGQQIGTASWISYNPCDITDWNLTKIILNDDNSYGIGTHSYMNSNVCPEGIFNNSTKGNYLKTFRISDNNCSSIYNNRVCIIFCNNSNGGSINDNYIYSIINNYTQNINLYKQSIFNNKGVVDFTNLFYQPSSIEGNQCTSIESNTSSGDLEIGYNRCTYIRNNTGTYIGIFSNSNNGNIQYNTTNASISSNTNNGNIAGNSNTGDILDNKNNGQIGSNSNTGSIIRNANNGWIVSNSSAGSISDTQVNK